LRVSDPRRYRNTRRKRNKETRKRGEKERQEGKMPEDLSDIHGFRQFPAQLYTPVGGGSSQTSQVMNENLSDEGEKRDIPYGNLNKREGDEASGFPRKKTVSWFTLSPSDSNAPTFTGTDVTAFLEDYDFQAEGAGWSEELKKQKLPYFCSGTYRRDIVRLPAYRNPSVNWVDFQKLLCSEYSSMDSEYRKSTRAYLESWLNEVSRQPIALNDYYHKFNSHTQAALARSQIVELEVGILFFRGLSQDDKTMVMHGMPIDIRPKGGDVNTYQVDQMYQFLRQCRDQDEAIRAMQQEERWVTSNLARSEAASLAMPLIPPPRKFFEKSQERGVLGIKRKEEEADAQVREVIARMGDLTLTMEEYTQWKASMPTAASLILSKPANDRYAFEKLVGPTLHVERNDGSFKSSYYPTTNPNSGVQMVKSREYQAQGCRTCGEGGHTIRDCPWRRRLIDNGWYHEIFNTETRYFDYHYGPKHLQLEKFRGQMPRSNGDAQLQHIIRELKQYFNVTDKDLEKPFSQIPGLEGKKRQEDHESGRAHFGTTKNNNPGEWELELDAIRRAEAFYETLSETTNWTEEVNTLEEANAVKTRSSTGKSSQEQQARLNLDKVTGLRTSRPVAIARTKDLRERRVRINTQPDIGEFNPSSALPTIDDGAMLDAALVEANRRASEPMETTEVYSKEGVQEGRASERKKGKLMASEPPSDEELLAVINTPNANSILMAALTQEVRGITLGAIFSQDELHSKAQKLLSKRGKSPSPDNYSRGGSSGTVFAGTHSYQQQKGNRSWEHPQEAAILAKALVEKLRPTLGRVAEGNAAQTTRYTIGEGEDGYQEEADEVDLKDRTKLEKQIGVRSILAKLPTCFVTILGNHCEVLLDSGSELNVMRYTTARALNVVIQDLDQSHLPLEERSGMIGASGGLDEYVGTAYSVPIKIGTVVIPTHFKIVRLVRRPIILGTPFAMAARLGMDFTPMGRCICRVTSMDGRRTVSFLGLDTPLLSNYELNDEDSGNA
jgi:hypothetical protein